MDQNARQTVWKYFADFRKRLAGVADVVHDEVFFCCVEIIRKLCVDPKFALLIVLVV